MQQSLSSPACFATDFADSFIEIGYAVCNFFSLKSGHIGFFDVAVAVRLELPVLVALADSLDLAFVESDVFHDVVQGVGQLLFVFDGQQAVFGGDYGLVLMRLMYSVKALDPWLGK